MTPRRAAATALFVAAVLAILLGLTARASAAQPAASADAASLAEIKDTLDRETPRRTLEGFLRESKQGNFRVAADYLDLRGIAAGSRDSEGPELAQKLSYVLERQETLNLWAASYFTVRTPTRMDDALLESTRRPLRTIMGALTYRLLLGPLQLTSAILEVCEHVTYTALVVGVTWLLLRALGVSTLLLDERAARESYDAFQGRRVRTQALLLRRVASVTLMFVAGAVVLMQFDFVRNVGLSLLASAGVLSVVAGLAAQKSLAGIIGGIQFSIAQPVRMNDHVLLEGQLGEIEEIYLTYAVVRLWDHRRMIVPITYFLEKPFQNWTRIAGNLLGGVDIKVDLGIPVDAVREELRRICEADPLWDKRSCEVKVTDSDAASMTLRAVVSAEDATRLWDLRCRVRERLLAFVHALVLARAAPPAKTPE